MKVEVLSVGGSLIIPKKTDKVDHKFLSELQKVLSSFKDRKFVIVAGGGTTARKYINALEKKGVDRKSVCLIGIGITRLNAKFLQYFFGKQTADRVPTNVQDVKKLLRNNKIVCTGALRFEEDITSDGTAAHIANYLRTDFINVTDVKGLYTKDPKKFKDVKLIKNISFKEFDKFMGKMSYHPGQHFILDQHASKIIKKHKICTRIVGKDLKNLKKCLQDKPFIGTSIS